MKNIAYYLFSVSLLGTFTGIFMSMGDNILPAIGICCLIWACMLTPMLAD
jgi:hypothetical protein